MAGTPFVMHSGIFGVEHIFINDAISLEFREFRIGPGCAGRA